MIQSGHLKKGERMDRERFLMRTQEVIDNLDVSQAKKEVEPFVKNPESLVVWSREFFRDVVGRIVLI